MMSVGDRNGQRVGSVRPGDFRAGQKPPNHRMDLRLVGCASADDGLFYQGRRIFSHLNSGLGGSHKNDAARLTQLQSRLRILVDEDLLGGRGLGRAVGDQGLQLASEVREPPGQRFGRVRPELSIGDMAQTVALGSDEAPAGRAKAGIEAEDEDQPSFSSSASEIS
jgi:hypothetical protein